MEVEQQTDEQIQQMSPLEPPSTDGDGGLGEGMTEVVLSGDDDIEIEVVGEELPEPVAKEVLEDDDPTIEDIEQELTEEQLQKLNLTKGVRGRLDKLTWQKNEERRQRERAELEREEAIRFAKAQQDRIAEMERVLAKGEEVMVSEVRSRTKSDLAAAEQEFKLAAESGDPDRMLSAQKLLNKAQVEAMQVDQYRPTQMPQAPPQVQQPAPPQGNPAEDPKLVSWMSENQWFKQDPVKTSEAMSIHRELTEIRGIDPRTDEYYNQLDSRLAQRFPDLKKSEEINEMPPSPTQQPEGSGEPAASAAPNVVAPPSGSTGPGSKTQGRKPRTVQLTPTQATLAETLGLTKEQYARQLLKEQSNG